MGIVAGTRPDFKTMRWPLSLATKAMKPLANPLRASRLIITTSRIKGYFPCAM